MNRSPYPRGRRTGRKGGCPAPAHYVNRISIFICRRLLGSPFPGRLTTFLEAWGAAASWEIRPAHHRVPEVARGDNEINDPSRQVVERMQFS